MELQFYGPGYVPQFEGFGCTAHQYCAAMTIDSFVVRTRTPGVDNNAACNNYVLGGVEPINWAYITTQRRLAGARQPAVHGHVDDPNFAARQPELREGPVDEPG